MYKEELERIIYSSQNNALTFFVGAGVSALSGAPTWKTLIDAICEKLGREKKEYYSSDEYLQIPQMLYYSLGENKADYYNFIKKQLSSANLFTNDIHREMFALNPVSFITTNYDTLLEDAAVQYCQSFKVVACDKDVPKIFGDKFILKLHGDFVNNNFVLKEEDYLNYSDNFKLIETLVKSIFATNTVVFIGYGLNDYNIKLILNWTKSLLKDNFRPPIFIYTGNTELTTEERLYHESKGLSVVEWYKLKPNVGDYINRYKSFFEELKSISEFSLNGKTEEEAFEILYNLLLPLNSLNALRIGDVSKRLSDYVVISEDGVIHFLHSDRLLLKKFFEINAALEYQKNGFSEDTIEKYNCILNVFKKARIFVVEEDQRLKRFISEETPFTDMNCILFDYNSMREFSTKEYESIEEQYKKAFYLSRLGKYDKSFYLFSDVAKQAFRQNNYLLYYLAKSNCISLRTIITNANEWYQCYDMSKIEALLPNDTEIENLFRSLPVEFRNTYSNLKDIHNANMLYKYSYNAFIDGQKLQNAIENNPIEFGFTSSGKAIYRINEFLHFLLGNGIIADIFNEYKSTVKNLMSLLVFKYSGQNKKTLKEQPFHINAEEKICFDEIDFYCFINCFNDKEIGQVLYKNNIDTLEFRDIQQIEKTVKNLLDYYDYAIKTTENNIDVINLQVQIKTCLVLLRYIKISQDLVDKICVFILTNEFREIHINDKILFLYAQLAHRNMCSKITSSIIENTLISYIDKEIYLLKKGEKFDLISTDGSINYYNLIHYITLPNEQYISRRLSLRISRILNNKYEQMYLHIVQHYCNYVSIYQKKRLITWVNKTIAQNFDFHLFTLLIQYKANINSNVKSKLKEYLKNKIDIEKNITAQTKVKMLPVKRQFDELDQVGYWCLIKILDKNDFNEFIGNSELFDFYYKYTNFDFKNFKVSWLLSFYPHTIEVVAKEKFVKENIRLAIADELKNNKIKENEASKLKSILIKYFL